MRKPSRRNRAAQIRFEGAGESESRLREMTDPNERVAAERMWMRLCLVVAVSLAGYLSILYFGHQTVPNSDFPDFFKTSEFRFICLQVTSVFRCWVFCRF